MTPEVIYAFYAADLIGATLNLVDPRYSVEGIRDYIEEVDSHLLTCLNVVYERCRQAAKRTHVERVIVLSRPTLPFPLSVGYKMTNPDKNKYKSNVLHWKQFLEGGEGQSTAAEPYDPGHARGGPHRRHHGLAQGRHADRQQLQRHCTAVLCL